MANLIIDIYADKVADESEQTVSMWKLVSVALKLQGLELGEFDPTLRTRDNVYRYEFPITLSPALEHALNACPAVWSWDEL